MVGVLKPSRGTWEDPTCVPCMNRWVGDAGTCYVGRGVATASGGGLGWSPGHGPTRGSVRERGGIRENLSGLVLLKG